METRQDRDEREREKGGSNASRFTVTHFPMAILERFGLRDFFVSSRLTAYVTNLLQILM